MRIRKPTVAKVFPLISLIVLSFLANFLITANIVSATGSISITSVTIPSSATQGDTFTITMSVTGSSVNSDSVTGSLTLPSGLSCTNSASLPISLSASGTGSGSWSCTASVAGDYSNSITASVTATDSTTTATLSDSKQTGLTVLTPASLTVSSTLSSSSIAASASTTFTVGVNNVGASSTTFNITLTCPSGLTCSPSSVGNTGISGSSLSNNAFTITAGSTAGSYTITATVQTPVQSALTTSQTLTVTATTTTVAGSTGGGTATTIAANATNATTGKVTKTFTSIISGSPKTLTSADIEASKTHLTEIYISVINRATSVSITIEKLAGKPADVSVDVSGKSYEYIKITKENLNDSNLAQGKLKFKIEKSWISANNIKTETIALYRYSNGVWNKLSTTKLSEDSNYIYYEATTPGFSYFAISGEAAGATTTIAETVTTAPTETTAEAGATTTSTTGEQPQAGFKLELWHIVLIAIIVITVVVVFLMKRS